MNCGFEDVQRLFEHIRDTNSISSALENYTATRRADLFAISDLAMDNYVEMRSSVSSKMYLARKSTEEFLYKRFPKLHVRTLYNMVSFTSIPYHVAMQRSMRQGRMFQSAIWGVGISALGITAYGVYKFRRAWTASN